MINQIKILNEVCKAQPSDAWIIGGRRLGNEQSFQIDAPLFQHFDDSFDFLGILDEVLNLPIFDFFQEVPLDAFNIVLFPVFENCFIFIKYSVLGIQLGFFHVQVVVIHVG